MMEWSVCEEINVYDVTRTLMQQSDSDEIDNQSIEWSVQSR